MENYHRHSHYSNIILPDSVATNEDYCKRAKQIGHTILSSCEHGTPGNYRQCAELAKKYGLRWRYVAEAYMVKDRFEKDKTNCHIILAAKTKKGIGDINEILSEANLTGYYYRARVDLPLLLTLDPKDVFVTTACIGGVWNYGVEYPDEQNKKLKRYNFTEPDRIVKILHSHFKDSFMLEVQNHNTPEQKKLNQHILSIYRNEGIKIIAGLDSHFIYEEDSLLRDQLLESRHLKYEEESGWYMDYPDDETCIKRFEEQGVLSMIQIKEAMSNADIFREFEDVEFDKSKKLPTIYPDKTQEERNDIYRELIDSKWNEYKKSVPEERWPEYEDAIKYEVDTVTSTNTSDYFLLDYHIVKRFKELGGRLTFTGRGSGPSYFTNTLLGFSSIDRLALPITMYPDRFISADRLKAGSVPDIDMNVADPEIFAKAQAEVIGEGHSAPMIAYGTLKRLSAWKMYCRASNVPFEIANRISDDLKKYELDYKHADEDDQEFINPFDYVPEEYHEQLRMSEKYLGMVDSISPHPCAYAITNEDIKRQFGIFRMSAKTGSKKDVYAAFIDGATADAFGYLKNDDLRVQVVRINADIYKNIGIEQPRVPELIKLVENDKDTWTMYSKGFTLGLNQAEKEKSTEKVMTYKPKNVTEMTAFCAGIRPGFQSMANMMFTRQRFSYHIPALDRMLVTREMPDSFILYQEQVMKILQYGGFLPSESYAAIKAIAKKHPEKVLPLKGRFLENFARRLVEEEHMSDKAAQESTMTVWGIIEDNTSYSFNASHACCVALDSIYTAYAKAHYPYETYCTLLRVYAERGDKDRIDRAKKEMRQAFGIKMVPCKFRQDNRDFFIDKENHTISDAMVSIKGIGKKDAEAFYRMKDMQFSSFTMMCDYMSNITGAINSSVIETLIRCDYFSEFGRPGKLLKVYRNYKDGENKITKTLKDATRQKRLDNLCVLETLMEQEELPIHQIIKFEAQKFGSPYSVFKEAKKMYYVIEVNTSYSPKLKLYQIEDGKVGTVKIKKEIFKDHPLNEGDIIIMQDFERKLAYGFANGKPVRKPGVFDVWLYQYHIVQE